MSYEQKPHFLKVKLTDRITEFLRASINEREIRDKLDEKIIQEVEQILEKCSGNEISEESKGDEFRELKFSSLRKVFELYKESKKLESEYFLGQDKIYIHQLLRESDVYFTAPKKPERNPQLVARLAKIQQKLDNQAYYNMVANLAERNVEQGSLAIDMKSLNIQAIHAFNILLSFVCAFVFGFATGYYNGLDNALSAIIGITLCIPVLLADIYFLLKYYEDGNRVLKEREQAITSPSAAEKKNQ